MTTIYTFLWSVHAKLKMQVYETANERLRQASEIFYVFVECTTNICMFCLC